ncbi:hypothetical protein GYH30_024115 [Glycine max]|uniref:Uncharacterized protein n=2 Tax=Glycine subgen. Soja TaxID=1462606 RepID=A0A0R0I7U9_SOYBN|nr:hypothetical protein GYH30_024115 [Glycine max]RZB90712.1 hypothetical protein D0Y65_023257 [Glycine soja]
MLSYNLEQGQLSFFSTPSIDTQRHPQSPHHHHLLLLLQLTHYGTTNVIFSCRYLNIFFIYMKFQSQFRKEEICRTLICQKLRVGS